MACETTPIVLDEYGRNFIDVYFVSIVIPIQKIENFSRYASNEVVSDGSTRGITMDIADTVALVIACLLCCDPDESSALICPFCRHGHLAVPGGSLSG